MLRQQMRHLKEIEVRRIAAPDPQISLTDPDARFMATRGRGSGMVGYNVQTAVDAKHHLIVAHEVTHVGHDRNALAAMAKQASVAIGEKDPGGRNSRTGLPPWVIDGEARVRPWC